MDCDLPPTDTGQHVTQRRKVEDVREALAVGLYEDRERAIPGCHGEEVSRPLALLP